MSAGGAGAGHWSTETSDPALEMRPLPWASVSGNGYGRERARGTRPGLRLQRSRPLGESRWVLHLSCNLGYPGNQGQVGPGALAAAFTLSGGDGAGAARP